MRKIYWIEFVAALAINAILTATLYYLGTRHAPFCRLSFAVLGGSLFSFVCSCPAYNRLNLADAEGRRIAFSLAGTASMLFLIFALVRDHACISGWYGCLSLGIWIGLIRLSSTVIDSDWLVSDDRYTLEGARICMYGIAITMFITAFVTEFVR